MPTALARTGPPTLHRAARLFLAFSVLLAALPLWHSPPVAQAQREPLTVTVTVNEVRALDCMEEAPWGCDGDPDFYARISIGDNTAPDTGTIADDHLKPGWSHTVDVTAMGPDVPIRIELFDDDGGRFSGGKDDKVDLTPGDGRALELSVNTRNCAVFVAKSYSCWHPIPSQGSDNDRAEITFTVDVNLPRTIFWGNVFDGTPPERTRPIQAHTVRLVDRKERRTLATTQTDEYGTFRFDYRPPADAQLRVELAACEGVITCDYFAPEIAPIDIQPTGSDPLFVDFDGCPPDGFCRFAPIDFFLERDLASLPPLVLSTEATTSPRFLTPPTQLRRDPPKATSGEVRLFGSGLHNYVEVSLYPANCTSFPSCSGDRAEIVRVSPDGLSLTVKVPEAITARGVTAFHERWFWGLRNTLAAGTSAEWQRLQDTHLNFANIYGFAFGNISDPSDRPSGAEFEAVFGNNTTICLGAFGRCAARVPDPFAWFYYEAFYKPSMKEPGKCVGFAATSQLMARGELQPSQFTPGTFYAAGLPGAGAGERTPPRPQRFGPTNLWGEIIKNHGAQMSAESFNAWMDDTGKTNLIEIGGNPVARLAELRSNPLGHVLCMNKGTSGHCVTAYAVEDVDATHSRIWVYDNRYPDSADDFVEIDRSANTYRLFQAEGQPDPKYRGTHLTTLPLSVWRGERSIPGLLDAARFALIAIFGDASPSYVMPDGTTLGPQPDGGFVEQHNGALLVAPFRQTTPSPATPLVALHPGTNPPAVTLTSNGAPYGYAAVGNRTFFRIGVDKVPAGVVDTVQPLSASDELTGFAYTPGHPGAELTPQVALAPAERERAAFTWAGLDLPAGGTASFSGVRDAYQVAYANSTSAQTRHFIVLEHVDGESGNVAKRFFGPFDVPAGATQRATILDWPVAARLQIELDRDGDGSADETSVARGIVPGERVSADLEALYQFDETDGDLVRDSSGAAEPLDLRIANVGAIERSDGQLVINASTTISSTMPATRMTSAIRASQELTLEAWVVTRPRPQAQPAGPIVTLSGERLRRDMALLHERGPGATARDRYEARLRVAQSGLNGRDIDVHAPRGPEGTLAHVVYTRDATGHARLFVDGVERKARSHAGPLTGWSDAYHLFLANEPTGNQPWLGAYDLVAIYSRALSPAEVAQNFAAGADGTGLTPATGVQVRYDFADGKGDKVRDNSGVGMPLDLDIADPNATVWGPEGLHVARPTVIASSAAALKLTDATFATNEVTLEAWVRAGDTGPTAPGTILALLDNGERGSFAVTQLASAGNSRERYSLGLRVRDGADDRLRKLRSVSSAEYGRLVHLVLTRDASGLGRVYLDGTLQTTARLRGDLSSWAESLRLAIAGDAAGNTPWMGTYRHLSVYNRALSPAEVSQHYAAGTTP